MKIKPFFRDLTLTFFTEIIVLLSFFLVYRLIANNYGVQGVGEYSLVKRIISFLQPIFFLGLGIGLPRYIAYAASEEERRSYAQSGLLVTVAAIIVAILSAIILKNQFSLYVFGSVQYSDLAISSFFLFAGLAMHGLVYSYLRGRILVVLFNYLQIINFSIIPVAVFIFAKDYSLDIIIKIIGISTFLVAFFFLIPFRNDFIKSGGNLKKSFVDLIQYSFPRIPGDFILVAFFSLPTIIAVNFVSIKEIGYLSLSQSIINAVGTAIAPLGLLLLPKVSNLMVRGRRQTIEVNLDFFICALIDFSLFLFAQLVIFIDIIIVFWLGPDFFPAVFLIRIMAVSVFFYAFYVSIRSVLDAVENKPLNTINLFVSLAVSLISGSILIIFFRFIPLLVSFSIAFVLGMLYLGVATYGSLKKIFYRDSKKDAKYLISSIAVNSFFAVVSLIVKSVIGPNVCLLIWCLALIGLLYVLVLWRLKRKWIWQAVGIIIKKND
ncbi:MAG TPA: lipopolysaccharide biosynthesis protein [Candidatus Paceibacterota bacterium]|nr:lipopolysaccharide biosynthesis protein [Candidatus Pacearchaeota archaeon]HRZ50676.1 lipopolysaccharide biosynthesis protein [Candidatus Paceibacterota bacterium]HSA36427.1 lipopolysaccharide biosynthesis protein [Candidatus Paceibacterota bacterium]